MFRVVNYACTVVMWTKSGTVGTSGKRSHIIIDSPHTHLFDSVVHNAWGMVAFVALCLLALGSHPWIRAKLYTFFWHSHIIGLLAFIIGVSVDVAAGICALTLAA